MIYFIQNTVTQAIKIGYSSNPKKRLDGLQTATPDKLLILGTMQGGLEHEAAFHHQFSKYSLQGEWFKGDILREVMAIIAKDAASPQPQKPNVFVWGGSDTYFVWSSDHQKRAERSRLEAAVRETLGKIHATTPIAWVVTGGERLLEHFAWQWADENKVQVYRYYPNWRKYGRVAAFKVGPQMLRSMFDPKLLIVFLGSKVSSTTKDMIRRAERAGIEVKTKALTVPATLQPLAIPGNSGTGGR